MSAKSHQPSVEAAPSASFAPESGAQDFGSNTDMQSDMQSATASGQDGPVRYRVKSSRGAGTENTWVFDAIGPGTSVGVTAGTKVTCGGLSGRVDITRPRSVVFYLFNETDPGSLSGQVATFHRGTTYGYGQWKRANDARKKKQEEDLERGDRANRGEREKEYKTRR